MRKRIIPVMVGLLALGSATIAVAQTPSEEQRPQTILETVLDELVDEGELTEDQAEAVIDRVRERTETIRERTREARELMREKTQAFLDRTREAWKDGSLSEEELGSVPLGEWLSGLAEKLKSALDDGELTSEELAELRESRGFGMRDRSERGPRESRFPGLGLADEGNPEPFIY